MGNLTEIDTGLKLTTLFTPFNQNYLCLPIFGNACARATRKTSNSPEIPIRNAFQHISRDEGQRRMISRDEGSKYVRSRSFRSMIRRNRSTGSSSFSSGSIFHASQIRHWRLPSPVPPPGISLRKCISGERAFSDVTHAHGHTSTTPCARTHAHARAGTRRIGLDGERSRCSRVECAWGVLLLPLPSSSVLEESA